ncbi:transposase [Ruminiclostridium hungatei]|uniref:Transposase n=1 Tax=Ruminiclostridium hungatei TaxID=48256 RepID=A0A1V4SDL7_RUMHU|nr:helix-turn-helix domain-containing protein [Ruminiclostridium hungatei]OPX41823.1 transposase [Ruminiclostridium hungatei]
MPQKFRIVVTEKIKITREYLAGKISREEAAKRAEVTPASIASWARIYRQEGALGLTPTNKNRVYSSELKKKAVLEYLAGGCGQHASCEKYAIRSRMQLQSWIKIYNTHGDFNSVKQSGGGSYMKKGRITTQEERVQIVRECIASGKNYGELALKYNVSYQQVRTWTLYFEEMGEGGLQDRRGRRKIDQTPRTELEQAQIEIEQLKHKLYLAEMERDLLKKLDEVERRDAYHK